MSRSGRHGHLDLQLNFPLREPINSNLMTHMPLQRHGKLALVETRLGRSAVYHLHAQQQTKRNCYSKPNKIYSAKARASTCTAAKECSREW
jgi:hypothetical protein